MRHRSANTRILRSLPPGKGDINARCRFVLGPGDDSDPDSPPISEREIRDWELKNGLRLPVSLAKALTIHNGGQVRGTDFVIEPLESFSVLDDEQWDHHLSPDNQEEDEFKDVDRSKLVLIGDCWGCGVVLDFRRGPKPKVLAMHHGEGGVLRDEASGTLDEFIAASAQ